MALYEKAEARAQAATQEQQEREERIMSSVLGIEDILDAEVVLPKLAPTKRMDIIMPGYSTIAGEAGAGKTTFILSASVEMALREGVPLIHVDLEMGLAGLKQTYLDILSIEEQAKLRKAGLLHIITKDSFYGELPTIEKPKDLFLVLSRVLDRPSFIVLDGMSEFTAWSEADDNDGAVMRRVISKFSVFAKEYESSFGAFEHLSKEAIKDGSFHAKGAVDKANASDGSVFIKTIAPYSHHIEGGIKVSVGAKRLRGGFGRLEPHYFKVGGQGAGRQLIYTPCALDDIPEPVSPERDSILNYLQTYAPDKENGRTKKQIVAATHVAEDTAQAVLDRLDAYDRINRAKDGAQYRYYALSEAERKSRPSI